MQDDVTLRVACAAKNAGHHMSSISQHLVRLGNEMAYWKRALYLRCWNSHCFQEGLGVPREGELQRNFFTGEGNSYQTSFFLLASSFPYEG